MPTMLNSHVVPPPFRQPDRRGQRNPVADLPAESLQRVAADDGALAIVAPRLGLFGRHDELGIDLQEHVRLDRDVRKEVRRVLVDAAEPGLVRRELDALGLLQPRLDTTPAAA